MPVTQTGEVQVRVVSKLSNGLDLSTVLNTIDRTFGTSFANGTGAYQANNSWGDLRTLLTATNEDIDLAGVLTNAFGAVLTFTELKGIILFAPTTNTGNLTVTRPAANGVPFLSTAGAGFALVPGGLYVYTNPSDAGIAVTAGTGDLININNGSGATQSYYIILIGTTV